MFDVLPLTRLSVFPPLLRLLAGLLGLWCLPQPGMCQTAYRVEQYDNRNGLQSHWVCAVQRDKQGFIWVALKDGALARFDGHTFKHFPLNDAEKRQFGGSTVANLRIDTAGRFWVLVQSQTAQFSPLDGRFTRVAAPPEGLALPNTFTSMVEGVWRRRWRLFDRPRRLERLGSGEVYTLDGATLVYDILEADEEVWVAAFEGLYKITPRRSLFSTIFSEPVDLQKGPATGNSCYGIAESGDWLWVVSGDLYRTPVRAPGRMERVYEKREVLGGYNMIADRQGWLWTGQYSRTFSRWSPAAPFRWEGVAVPQAYKQAEIHSYLELPDGKMLAACADGLAEVDWRAGKVVPVLADTIRSAWHGWMDTDGSVWVGTNSGLFHISAQGGAYRLLGHYHTGNYPGLGSNKIISIHEAAGFLWLGSDAGLIRFPVKNPNLKAKVFTTADGLPNNKVYYALPERDFLWCGTDWGLARVSLASVANDDAVPDIRSFHMDDGLPHEEFNTLSFHQSKVTGKIYLGGLNGVTVFDPDNLRDLPTKNPPLVLTEYEKYDQRRDSMCLVATAHTAVAMPIVLNHYDQFLTLRFALLDYADPRRNRYLYRLEGYEKRWNTANSGSNFAHYSALPPGHYLFRVRAADHNGNWGRQEIEVPIVVLQAWYRTWWAWSLYVFAALGLGWAFYRQRLNRARLAAQLQLEFARATHLEEMDKFKSRFFTNITHEFRTPLTVILGMADRLPSDNAAVGMVKRNAERLLGLINQLLDLAKLESQTIQLAYTRGDVVAYVRYIAESLHSFANAQNILIQVESEQVRLEMDYDPERLQQILHNLLSNAINFTPSGGRVTILLASEAGMLRLRVADTGVGIAPEDLPRLFDRFFQAGNSEHAKTGGTGIGLALVKELIGLMGGNISVESVLGQGTIFTVHLPLVAFSAPSNGGVSQAFVPTSDNGRPLILIVEDNPDVVAYLGACLAADYRLDYAYNGRAGLEKALELVPDLLLSDVMMPEKDGFELCEAVKNDLRTNHVPVVLLTAKVGVESRIAGLRRGADAYLAKPFHEEELRVTVAKLLEGRRLLREHFQRQLLAKESPPQWEAPSGAEGAEHAFVQAVRAAVEADLGNPDLGPADICRKVGMGHTNLNLKMNALTGMPVTQFIRALRLQKAQTLLRTTDQTIAEIAYEVGFNDPKYFTRVFTEAFGMPPSAYRE